MTWRALMQRSRSYRWCRVPAVQSRLVTAKHAILLVVLAPCPALQRHILTLRPLRILSPDGCPLCTSFDAGAEHCMSKLTQWTTYRRKCNLPVRCSTAGYILLASRLAG